MWHVWGEEKCSQGLGRKHEGTRRRRRGKNTVNINFMELECEGMYTYLTNLTKDRGKCRAVMEVGMNVHCPQYAGMFGTLKGKGRPSICLWRHRR